IVIRTNYSNPPIHGGAIVAAVLNNPELRALWEKELGEMRVRIKAMRQKLVDGLKAAGIERDMGFITNQIGMFSYSGLTKDQMGAPALRVWRVRHRHRPHVRGRPEQQKHRLRLRLDCQSNLSQPFQELAPAGLARGLRRYFFDSCLRSIHAV
ncbi:MAG: hypothetical protein RIR45_1892, partial [Pseudomonadota bacterium]